jgi:TadE-like protein
VELALMLPIMAIFLLGAIDLGLIVREHQILQNAAREGARFSILPENCIVCRPTACSACPGGCSATGCKTQSQVISELKQRVIDYLASSRITGVTASNITIDQTQTTIVNGVGVGLSVVSVSYNRSFLLPGGAVLGFNAVTLNGSAVFRNLY